MVIVALVESPPVDRTLAPPAANDAVKDIAPIGIERGLRAVRAVRSQRRRPRSQQSLTSGAFRVAWRREESSLPGCDGREAEVGYLERLFDVQFSHRS
jgi:hypothetical protein